MRILTIALMVISFSALAQNHYINGIQKITLRTGPGTTNKILKMLETDSKVVLIEAGEEWSKVRDSEGVEGYILNRFMDTTIPFSLRYAWLKSEYDKLKLTQEESLKAQKEIQSQLAQTKKELLTAQANLAQVNTSFEELKTGSTKYLQLKQKYEETNKSLENQSDKVSSLESKLITHYIYWFLAGAGVLLLGWIIGGISRKKKSYGSSIRL